MFQTLQPFILASSSPRRIELLDQFGLEFKSIPADIDETAAADEKPADFVLRMACDKANYVAARNPGTLVIGADTVITVDGETILGKPKDRNEALSILQQLAGNSHHVMTGVCLSRPDKNLSITHVETTRVTFVRATDDLLRAYIATGEPMDKAGAYGIQGRGTVLIQKIDGSCSNVIGLPVSVILQLLMEYRIITPLAPEHEAII